MPLLDELLPEAQRLAGRLAAQSAEALRGTKRVINVRLSRALSGAMQAGFAAEAVSMQSAGHRERLLALRRGPAARSARPAPADRHAHAVFSQLRSYFAADQVA